MKLPCILPFTLIASLFCSSCASIPSNEAVAGFAGPAATVAVAAVLSQTKDPDARESKAEKITQIADALILLSDDNIAADDVTTLVSSYAHGDARIIALATTLGVLYERYGSKLGSAGQRAVINDIAQGIKAGAALSGGAI